jgi:probable F420-dependent oxidoreductase
MKFGVILPNFGSQATRLNILDTALAAERLGYESVWATDHLALPESDADRFGHLFETVTTLAWLAGSTGSIRLGISALVLPQRNPLEVGKMLASLDALSGGRVMLAAGIGWSEGEYRNLGYDFQNRAKRMDEALQVLRTLWRGGRVISYKGKYYSFERVSFSPGPVQSGGPVLWVAGNSLAALRRAAFFADGWHPNLRTPEELERSLKSAARLLGSRPFTVSLRMRVALNRAPETEYTLSGKPPELIERMRAFTSAGMTHAVIHFEADSQAEREAALKSFARDVAPAFA